MKRLTLKRLTLNHLTLTSFSYMKKLAVITLFSLNSSSLSADDHAHHQHKNHGTLLVEDAYATPTFALAKMGAGYFTLKNVSDSEVVITELSVSKNVARTVEMHETYLDGEMAKMRRLSMPYVIKAGATVEFVPQGKHLMIIGLNSPLETGNSFDVTLTFASGAKQVVTIPVDDKNGKAKEHHHHH